MAVLEIEELHARYDHLHRAAAERLDEALAELAHRALTKEATRLTARDNFAVCIPELALRIDADSSSSVSSIAAMWAVEIADAIEQRINSGSGVVIYRRELDVVIDIVMSMIGGEMGRQWAWRQTGVISGSSAPSPRDLAVILSGRPEMVPGVFRAVTDPHKIPLTVEGWLQVARAVAARVQPVGSKPTTEPPENRATLIDLDGRLRSRQLLEILANRRVADIWRQTHHTDRHAFAVMLLAWLEPALARDIGVIDEVVLELDESTDEVLPTATLGNELDGSGTLNAAPPEEPSLLPTAFGGVLFLVHAMRETNVVGTASERDSLTSMDPTHVVAQIAARVSGVAITDLVMLTLAGCGSDEGVHRRLLAPLSERQADDLDALASEVNGWLDARLGNRETDRNWLWRRPAIIEASPGWIEAEFSLQNVDTRIRAAGLDLDPDFVWWLGSVMRFHYV